jgi:hypothetical protein
MTMKTPRREAAKGRELRRHASDVPKPTCPWCGASTSSVYASRGDLVENVYRRRRQCAECGRDWPTVESLDVVRFVRDLAALGLTLADLGLTDGGAT